MSEIKLIVISFVLLFIPVVTQGKVTRVTDMTGCYAKTKSDERLFLNDKIYDNKSYFKFFINSKDAEKIKSLISSGQLIDLNRQLIAADIIYQDVLGLTTPLDKPRYKKASYIKIIMALIDSNGMAFDEVTPAKAQSVTDCHLSIKIKATLKASNGTPAHELFHLYQSSYFMFKNRWLTEGTARWSESLLKKDRNKKIETVLPQSREELEATMQLAYDASQMWSRLFQLIDDKEEFDIPISAKAMRYINGNPVVENNQIYGSSFIKILFDELEIQSKQAANDKKRDIYNWKEVDQKSSDNNIYIWKAVQNAVNKSVPVAHQSQELKNFISISLL